MIMHRWQTQGDHLRPGEAKAVPSHDSQTTPALEGMLWVVCNPAKFGGPCRGRTYGPLIKREKEPFLKRLAIATVSLNCLQSHWLEEFHQFYLFLSFPFPSRLVWSQKWSQSKPLVHVAKRLTTMVSPTGFSKEGNQSPNLPN